MKHPSSIVANIGGVFIYASNPQELADWYKEHFGINYEHSPAYKAWYASFPYTDAISGKTAYFAWSILPAKERPESPPRLFTINYRVNNLEELSASLKSKGIEVSEIQVYSEGKFAHMRDPEGNFIELWEDTTLQ